MPIAQPEVTASLRAAGVTAGLTPERLLFVGQQNGVLGTAVSGALTSNIGNDGAEDTLYGADSPLAAAIRRARRRNPATQIDAIGLDDDGAGVAATGAITFLTAPPNTTISIGSKKFNTYSAGMGQGVANRATVLAALINADLTSLVTAVANVGVVELTAKNAGTFGNTIGIKVEGTLSAITITPMAGGATDPTLAGVLDVIGSNRYQGIVWQFDQDTAEVSDFLDARFNVTNNVLDGRAFVGMTNTYANHLSALGGLNSNSLCVMVDKLIAEDSHQGPGVLEVPFVKAAEFAAIRALRRTDEAVLGGLVISRSAQDSFGGPWQNSKPYFNTPFPDCLVPDSGDTFTDVEVEALLAAGGWVIDANRANTAVIAGEVVTTYKTDSAGNPDPTFGFLNYVDTSTAAREYIVNNTRSQYPQYRATSGALISGVDSANEASIASFVAGLNSDLGDLGLVNTGVGSIEGATVDFDKLFRENLVVSLNPVTGKFLVSAKLYIVVQLRGITYDLAVAFEV
jgi:phage tail sheath gpL-like